MTAPYYADESVTVHHGDCLDVLAELPDASVDAVVTDPPYLLGFMGRAWDTKAAHEHLDWHGAWAAECLRLLKPGGHLLAFGGSRTWHRLACAVEDAGFEIRDSIAWLHGQGFPKGRGQLKPAFEPVVVGRKRGPIWLNVDGCRVATSAADAKAMERANTPGSGRMKAGGSPIGTFERSSATGAMDTTAGRWPTNVVLDGHAADELDRQSGPLHTQDPATRYRSSDPSWSPAGTERGTHREAKQATGGLDEKGTGAARFFPTFRYEAKAPAHERPRVKTDGGSGRVAGTPGRTGRQCNICGNRTVPPGGTPWPACGHEDWSTFTTEDRSADHVAHPTVKPLDLMRWLVRLVTPPGGTVLDPFAGSGTTAEACVIEGFRCITVEREAAYLPLITARLSKPIQPDLFGGAA